MYDTVASAAHPILVRLAVVVLVLFCIRIVRSDFSSRRIPNICCAAIAGLAIIWWVGLEGWAGLISFARQLAMALVIAIPLLGLFALRVFAGGDVKLLLALLLWVPTGSVIGMFMIILLSGGVLALMLMVLSRIFCAVKSDTVPYGVPIVFGAMLILAPGFVATL